MEDKLVKAETHPDILTLLWYDVQKKEDGEDRWPVISSQPALCALFEKKRRIGWNNVELGILGTKFRLVQTEYIKQKKNYTDTQATNITSKWIRTVQSALWEYVWENWNNRNKYVHGENKIISSKIKMDELTQQIENIFKSNIIILAEDRNLLSNKESILKRGSS